MLGQGRTAIAALVCTFAVLVAGCASIAPTSSTAPSALDSPLASSSAATSSVAVPSDLPPTPKPTRKPRKTAPPTSGQPSSPASLPATTGPSASGPNIAITGFVSVTDEILVGAQSSGRVTLLNNGPLEVGQFFVGITWVGADGLSQGFSSPVSVDGMVPGQSFDITVDLSLSQPGDVIFTAKADTEDVLKEFNEDDNSRTLEATAVSLPNLAFSTDQYKLDSLDTLPTGIDQNGQTTYDYIWEFTVNVLNTGSVAAPPYVIGFFYYDAAGQRVDGAPVANDESIPPSGQSADHEFNVKVEQNTTTLYLELDPLDDIVEFDEGDNDSTVIPEIVPQ